MRDTATRKRTARSSLCKKVALRVPEGWESLTQQQMCHVFRLCTLYGGTTELMKSALLVWVNSLTVVRNTDAGWLCTKEGRRFLLDSSLIPDILNRMSWLDSPEGMTDRIEEISGCKAYDMFLRKLPFGEYLMLENFYQAFLASRDAKLLERMTRILYSLPEEAAVEDWHNVGTFMWYAAVKMRFAREFPHFLKPVGEGAQTGTQQSQKEMMAAQIRLLTKGDITKNNAILNTDTWSALEELDALARDAEDFKKKNKKNV